MLSGLIGRLSTVSMLKEGLDASSARARVIASRVANASDPGGFAVALDGAGQGGAAGVGQPVDLETEMVALADEQLRYQAMASLLQRVYAQVRASVRER
ncbi:MAG: hypothetical protein IRZ00_05790 [Gemmatimonadetes bacterium]|nr:hypothetical protein [Gemmatimonadota bacterium]